MHRFVTSLMAVGSALAMPASSLFERQECAAIDLPQRPTALNQKLPDPFTSSTGQKITTKAQWECRRQEISKQFQAYELGEFPGKPDSVSAVFEGDGITVKVTVGNATVTHRAVIKKPAGAGPFPAIIGIGGITIPVPENVATISFSNDMWAAQTGVQSRGKGLFYDLFGKEHTAGSLIAWAWGVGRLIDGLEQLGSSVTGIDAKKLGVTGCSRNGKGAFVVGAFEERIALTLPVESGTGGAGCWRVAASEEYFFAKNIQTAHQIVQENTWFTEGFGSFGQTTVRLPIDHHELAGLVAPRGLFVMDNDIDWLGPVSTTVCMKAGRLVYKGLGIPNNMGFSLTQSHNHCQFPASDLPALNAFIDYFLLNTGLSPPNVETSHIKVDVDRWVDWQGPGAFL